MTSLHLFLLILLMRVAHFSYIVTSIITYATFKFKVLSYRRCTFNSILGNSELIVCVSSYHPDVLRDK